MTKAAKKRAGPRTQPYTLTGDFTIDLMKQEEGFVGGMYLDTVNLKTIGFGHLVTKDDIASGRIKAGTVFNEAEAEELLKSDIKKHQDPWLNQLKKPVTDAQKAALTSLAFNAGPGASQQVVKLINEGNMTAAADKFLSYNKVAKIGADGKPVIDQATGKKVLVESAAHTKRRKEERAIFLSSEPMDKLYAKHIGPTRSYKRDDGSFSQGVSPTLAANGPGANTPVDALMAQNQDVHGQMIELARKINNSDGSLITEFDYLERLRQEGRGVA